jgi:hypothetical protein
MYNFAILSGFGFRFLDSDFTGSILGDYRLKFDFALDLRSKSGGFFFCSPKAKGGFFHFLVTLLCIAIFGAFFRAFARFDFDF